MIDLSKIYEENKTQTYNCHKNDNSSLLKDMETKLNKMHFFNKKKICYFPDDVVGNNNGAYGSTTTWSFPSCDNASFGGSGTEGAIIK